MDWIPMEFPDWAYYLANVALLASQLASWSGNVCRLPANWILVANAALYASFFPAKLNGLGFGYGSVLFFMILAILGESLAFAGRQRRKLAETNRLAGLENTMLGAGAGSLLGAMVLFWIPLIGPFLALVGAVTGAAGGAYVGTLYSRSRYESATTPQSTNESAAPGAGAVPADNAQYNTAQHSPAQHATVLKDTVLKDGTKAPTDAQPTDAQPTDNTQLTAALELAARLITGALIVLLSSYSSFSG